MKIFVTLAIFLVFADFVKAFLAFSHTKNKNFVKSVSLAIFAIFVTQSFNIARKLLRTFTLFAKLCFFFFTSNFGKNTLTAMQQTSKWQKPLP